MNITQSMISRLTFLMLLSGFAMAGASANALTLVSEGEAQAVVVTADEPTPAAEHAINELVEHVEAATGVRLQIVRESDVEDTGLARIYVGNTKAARSHEITADELPPNVFVLRTLDDQLFIVGKEQAEADIYAGSALRGTIYGVYELLERYVGVRWLWPGDLGTQIPFLDTLVIDDDLDERVEPAFAFRRFRVGHLIRALERYDPDLGHMGFSEPVLRDYVAAVRLFTMRHRLGDTNSKPRVGHHFSGWWERYGKEHPEWFMLNTQGTRGPLPGRSTRHVAMCVSNPDLHRYIVENDWDGGDVLSLGEVDARAFCQCENCRAWDVPVQEESPSFARPDYEPQLVSDRYARFWKTIHEMASRRNPDVMVTTFLYWNYFPAPVGDIELHEGIYGEFVPWTGPYVYFPMPEERLAWKKEQWLRWKDRGITMAYRPNHFHGGYVLPNISTWQAGEFFQFAHENGMIGFDFDSLFGHWATKGPMLYMYMRLFVNPEMPIEQIRKEYFAAFGPAAEQVERYFDYWEARSGVRGGNPVDVVRAYPPRVFQEAARILQAAENRVAGHADDRYTARVAFLKAGLEHARLATHFVRSTNRGKVPNLPAGIEGDDGLAAGQAGEIPEELAQFLEVQQALKDLIAFRKEHEHLFIADMHDAARREQQRIDVDRLLEGKP